MNTQLKTLIVAVSATFLGAFAAGCGEMPENPDDIMIYGDGVESISEEAATSPNTAVSTDFARGPVLEENFVDPSTEIEQGIDLEDAYEEAKRPSWEDASDLSDIDADDAEPRLPAGFADGCASSGEWKSLAHAVCSSIESELGAFKLGESCGQEQYRLSRFGCQSAGDSERDGSYNKFSSIIVGGEGSCKTIDSFIDYASDVCGEGTKVVEAKALKQCGDADVQHYESVRVTCIDLP